MIVVVAFRFSTVTLLLPASHPLPGLFVTRLSSLPLSKCTWPSPSYPSWQYPLHYNLGRSSIFHSTDTAISYKLFLLDIFHDSSILLPRRLGSPFHSLSHSLCSIRIWGGPPITGFWTCGIIKALKRTITYSDGNTRLLKGRNTYFKINYCNLHKKWKHFQPPIQQVATNTSLRFFSLMRLGKGKTARDGQGH